MAKQKGGRQAAADQQQSEGAAASGRGRGNGLTKLEAVRRALAEMGRDAKPLQLQAFVKERFGIDMTADHVSTYKGTILRKEAEGRKAARAKNGRREKKVAAQAAAPVTPATSTRAGRSASGGISLEDITAVKDLVQRVGADSLRVLIDVLAR